MTMISMTRRSALPSFPFTPTKRHNACSTTTSHVVALGRGHAVGLVKYIPGHRLILAFGYRACILHQIPREDGRIDAERVPSANAISDA